MYVILFFFLFFIFFFVFFCFNLTLSHSYRLALMLLVAACLPTLQYAQQIWQALSLEGLNMSESHHQFIGWESASNRLSHQALALKSDAVGTGQLSNVECSSYYAGPEAFVCVRFRLVLLPSIVLYCGGNLDSLENQVQHSWKSRLESKANGKMMGKIFPLAQQLLVSQWCITLGASGDRILL